MTPETAIAMLDRQIAAHGQPVAFRRGASAQVSARGFVRGYKPEELVGMVEQADRQMAVSPTTLGAFVPQDNDDVSIAGRLGKVMDVEPVQIGATVVRFNLRVRMA